MCTMMLAFHNLLKLKKKSVLGCVWGQIRLVKLARERLPPGPGVAERSLIKSGSITYPRLRIKKELEFCL